MSTVAAERRPSFSLAASLRTCWTILKISIEERLVYRGEFMLGTLMRFLPMITQIFFWAAVFSASGKIAANSPSAPVATAASGSSHIAGYAYPELIAYLLLTMVTRAFSSMPTLASGIARSIRDGTIKKFLTQPVDMLGFLLIGRVAHKLVYYMIATLPFALVFYLCRGFFPGWPSAPVLATYVCSLILSFLLGYFLDSLIGLVGFWFLEVSSLMFVYMLMSFFLAGQMFPLDMLQTVKLGPLTAFDVVRWTPFPYLAYFPAAIFLGRIRGMQLVWVMVGEIGWVVALMVICRIAWNRGVRRYSAFGG
jgi:ABC-2 type transport system permease protein